MKVSASKIIVDVDVESDGKSQIEENLMNKLGLSCAKLSSSQG